MISLSDEFEVKSVSGFDRLCGGDGEGIDDEGGIDGGKSPWEEPLG